MQEYAAVAAVAKDGVPRAAAVVPVPAASAPAPAAAAPSSAWARRCAGDCCCPGCCPDRRAAARFLLAALLALGLLNALCHGRSPLHTGVPAWLVVAAVALPCVGAAAHRARRGSRVRVTQGAGSIGACCDAAASRSRRTAAELGCGSRRTLLCPVALYCSLILPLWIGCRIGVYPWTFGFGGGARARAAPSDAQEFTFVSSHDGARIRAGCRRQQPARHDGHEDAPPDPGTTVVPLLFLGGNGGEVWGNLARGASLVVGAALNRTFAFTVCSYSYRGSPPNDALWASEAAMVADTASLFEAIVERHNGTRALVMAHSLGTGPAASLANRGFGTRGGPPVTAPACLLLASPFSTMRALVLELTFFSAWPWVFLADRWDSLRRLREMPADLPLAVLSPLADVLIQPHFHRRLFEAAAPPAGVKVLLEKPGEGHNALSSVVKRRRRGLKSSPPGYTDTEMDAIEEANRAAYRRFLRQCLARI